MAIHKLLVLISHHHYFKGIYKNLIQSIETITCKTGKIKVGIYEQKSPYITFVFHNHWTENGEEGPCLSRNKREIECIIKHYCNDYDRLIIFLHRSKGIYFPAIDSSLCEKDVREYRFGGDNLDVTGVDYNLKQLLDRLERQEVIAQEEFSFNHEHFDHGELKNFIHHLTPLYLSLQTFWGITIADATENKVSFAQLGNNKNSPQFADAIRQKLDPTKDTVDEQYLSLFPNPNAFSLVEEAEYDFYAPLFDMVLSPEDKGKVENWKSQRGIDENKNANCDIEKNAYDIDTLSELLQKTTDERFQKLIAAFNRKIGDSWQSVDLAAEQVLEEVWFSIEIKDRNPIVVSYQLFVDCLRELCTLLANTKSYGRRKKGCARDGYFGYKGKKEFQVLRDTILKGLSLSGKEHKHCKLAESKEEYDKLVQQLSTWGIEKAMVVLGGIRKLCS